MQMSRRTDFSMRFDIITIFPGFFAGPFDYGILKRARAAGLVSIATHDLRSFTHDRHRTVDDRPFGGGEGMVLKASQSTMRCSHCTLRRRPSGRESRRR